MSGHRQARRCVREVPSFPHAGEMSVLAAADAAAAVAARDIPVVAVFAEHVLDDAVTAARELAIVPAKVLVDPVTVIAVLAGVEHAVTAAMRDAVRRDTHPRTKELHVANGPSPSQSAPTPQRIGQPINPAAACHWSGKGGVARDSAAGHLIGL